MCAAEPRGTMVRITPQGKKLAKLLSSQTPAAQAQTYHLLSERVRQTKRGKTGDASG